MPLSTIMTVSTVMKNFKVQLNDLTLPDDDIMDVRMSNSFFKFGVNASLTFKDSYSLLNSKSIKFDGTTVVNITVIDFMQNRRKFNFVVYDMEVMDAARVNTITLKLIDPFAYKLQNLYVPKSFSGTIVDAFNSVYQNYGLEAELSKNKLTLVTESAGESKSFIMGSQQSAMDFFNVEFRLANIRMWQDDKHVYIKEFKLSSAEQNEKPYKGNSTNNNYLFKIHDFKKTDLKKSNVPLLLPRQEVVRFRNKTVIRDTINLSDFYSELLLNGNDEFKAIQDDATGNSYSTMNDTVEAQKYDLFNIFMKNEQLDIVVAGTLKENQPGKVVKVELADKSMYVQAQQLGNRTSSGKWFCTCVQSRFLGGRFIQRLRLGRFDHPKV